MRPFGPRVFDTPTARFSTEIEAREADALLCEWAPTRELLDFDGPRAWYTAEPRTNPRIGVLAHRDQRRFAQRLSPWEALHHAHPDPHLRVPHVTHATAEPTDYAGPREERAVSVVSNFGGPIWNRGPGVRLRNAFATSHRVALYGRPDKWRYFRPRYLSRRGLPPNFAGGVEGTGLDKIDLLARYRVAVCLENTCEPWYFSEKFVDAARAGCVPVYHAHETVRRSVLSGARWVDPADHDFDVERTLDAAFTLDREAVAEQNFGWLGTDAVRATSELAVWERIACVLRARSDAAEP